jgi:hypothetical protein
LVSLARLSMMPTEESKNAHVYNRVWILQDEVIEDITQLLRIYVLLHKAHLVIKDFREDIDDEQLVWLQYVGAQVLCDFFSTGLVVVDHLEQQPVDILGLLTWVDEGFNEEVNELEFLKYLLPPLTVAIKVFE